ncbi:PREDICTED: At4g22160 [Prunus dulcis]|uniref:PREDICTED: At4g22160 n=1 Tax=Prunus dulcis TaxID=3755 RepID=A0A5E4F0F2_PRUDU|nr:uncharacterized protein At4g22160 [Prunus dulcis]KAI5330834.1 hypothetical protein L3X38_020960 [Prunus dulcis]VVA21527.1 PREDICTED: At4g22160 [Prunus dulcis]
MAFQTGRTRPPNRNARNNEGRQNYAFDAGLLSGARPNVADRDDEDSDVQFSSDSESSSDSDGESTRLSGLAASFRVVSDSLLRMEQTELEMAKAREGLRLKAEKQRVELEAELTQMLLQTQLQVASLVSQQSPRRKRKRVEDADESLLPSPSSSISQREGALVLSLVQCNLLF